jgi:hypothetical protein
VDRAQMRLKQVVESFACRDKEEEEEEEEIVMQ